MIKKKEIKNKQENKIFNFILSVILTKEQPLFRETYET